MRLEQQCRELKVVQGGEHFCRRVKKAVAQSRQVVLEKFSRQLGEHGQLLRLALNEAEALAWQTDYPHLFFPSLAAEKAQAAATWHQRQRAVRRRSSQERAFAE